MVGIDAGDASFDTAGETGGSKDAIVVSHTHTASVTDPGHIHTTLGYGSGNSATYGNGGGVVQTSNSTASATTGVTVSVNSTGSSGTNANLQPYVVVYMWKRTA